MNMLWVHSVYSSYKFYGFKLSKVLSDKIIKRISIALGTIGQLVLSAGFWGQISEPALVYSRFTYLLLIIQYIITIKYFNLL